MSGLKNAPFSKAFLFLSISISCFNISNGIEKDSELNAVSLFLQSKGLLKLFSYPFCYSDPGQLVLGTIILYKFRHLERLLGSSKYAVLVSLSTIFGLPIIILLSLYTSIKISSGPMVPLFSSLILYYTHVPIKKTNMIGFCGTDFSEKSITYLLFLQLFMSVGSKVPAAIGITFGCLYTADAFTLQSYRLPVSLLRVISFFEPLFRSSPRQARPLTLHFGQGQSSATDTDFASSLTHLEDIEQAPLLQGSRAAEPAPPDEEHVATLEAMGFERTAAINALQRTGSNVERAAHSLLETAHIADTEPSQRSADENAQHTHND